MEGLKAVIIELKRHHVEITKMMSQATIRLTIPQSLRDSSRGPWEPLEEI